MSTGRSIARRKSIASAVQHGGGHAGELPGPMHLLHAASLDLSGVVGSTRSLPAGVSNGDGISRSNSAASPSLASVASADSTASASGSQGGENDSQAAATHSNPVGWELVLENRGDPFASSASMASASGVDRHTGASRAAQEEQQQWERSVAATLQSQAVAISVMQSQIGALSEMMRDANSKMDSLLQLQRHSMAQLTAAAAAPSEQPSAVAATASSAPAHMPACAEAQMAPEANASSLQVSDGDSPPERGETISPDAPLHSGTNDIATPDNASRLRRGSITAETVIAEDENGEEDDEEDDDGFAAAPDGGLRTTKQDEVDL